MKPNTYTTKPAHTGTDKFGSYVIMSDDLEQKIQFDERQEVKKSVTVRINELSLNLSFFSLELVNDQNVILCVDCSQRVDPLIDALLGRSLVSVDLSGKEFKSHVLKVESGRCYLRLSR